MIEKKGKEEKEIKAFLNVCYPAWNKLVCLLLDDTCI